MINNLDFNKNIDAQAVLNQVVLEFMREQKRKRIKRWIWRVVMLIVIITIGFKAIQLVNHDRKLSMKSHVGLIDLNGKIADDAVNADNLAKSLATAYKQKGLKALVLRINSPGGSPVQADYMYNLIRFYRQSYPKIAVYAVCVDMCASAAYYVAAAADSIYANESSMVGSIGVVFNGFGFVDTLQKLGITRRLQTAGVNKGFLDPFSPIITEQEQQLQTMLDAVHTQFINKVNAGRGRRLTIDNQTFSGLIWTGKQAKTRGLIDGFASSGELIRNVLKLDRVVDYSYKPSIIERVSKTIGIAAVEHVTLILGGKNRIDAAVF
jgi:protease-4